MSVELETTEIITEAQQAEMASDQHGEIGAILIWRLSEYVYPNRLGRVFNAQTSFKLNPAQPARMPDAAFVQAERLPIWNDDEVAFAPDLAVEVMSRHDDWSDTVHKARSYLEAGSKLVWVVDPYEQNVFVFQTGQHMVMLTPPDELDGYAVLPGFKLKVNALFN